MTAARRLKRPFRRPDGAVAMSFAASLPVVLGLLGVAIDLSLLYLRNTELQQLADATAVAAAAELNGTAAGAALAATRSEAIAEEMTWGGPFRPHAFEASWTPAALFLGSTPTGPWQPVESVTTDALAADLVYARVDTAVLANADANPGLVGTNVLSRLLDADASVTLTPVSVAGRVAMNITPLGVCALSTTKFEARQAEPLTPTATPLAPELVEFGFRRGITYDLRDLNPAEAAGTAFVIDPLTPGDRARHELNFGTDNVKPFFCSGTIAYGTLRPDTTLHNKVHVKSLAGLTIAPWLNSRFGDYAAAGACARDGAPPDAVLAEYTTPALSALAINTTVPAARMTLADVRYKAPAPHPTYTEAITAASYGPLWVYSKPVRAQTDAATNTIRPTTQVFVPADWSTLYQVTTGSPRVATGYPTNSVPYKVLSAVPSSRRMLNVALLDCSSTVSSTATVLGIGRFFMTSRATSIQVYGEFGGLADAKFLASSVSRIQ